MLGLSITAIGCRPLADCLAIYEKLKEPLALDFLELAVGTRCDLSAIPKSIPLVIHDRALYVGAHKLPFSLCDRRSWYEYRDLLCDRDVKLLSLHPPRRDECNSLDRIKRYRAEMEEYFGIDVCLEVMPDNRWYLSNIEEAIAFPLLVDVSHVNIWTKGSVNLTSNYVDRLLPHAKAVHLSHNSGTRDSHDMIPSDSWFVPLIERWRKELIVTFESLPSRFEAYERRDKQILKQKRGV